MLGLASVAVFAAMFFLDTGAVLHLVWTGISGELGFVTRLLTCGIAVTFLLALLLGMWHWTARPAPSKRAAPKKRTRRPRLPPDGDAIDQST